MHHVEQLLDKLDGRGSDEEWEAVYKLREALGDSFPSYLLPRYRAARRAGERSSCVYHSIRYARESADAVELGRLAIQDRSKVVRHEGCLLLAYSLRKDVVPDLKAALEMADGETHADLAAAIDAIEHQNHNYFVDREHSGKITLNIG